MLCLWIPGLSLFSAVMHYFSCIPFQRCCRLFLVSRAFRMSLVHRQSSSILKRRCVARLAMLTSVAVLLTFWVHRFVVIDNLSYRPFRTAQQCSEFFCRRPPRQTEKLTLKIWMSILKPSRELVTDVFIGLIDFFERGKKPHPPQILLESSCHCTFTKYIYL